MAHALAIFLPSGSFEMNRDRSVRKLEIPEATGFVMAAIISSAIWLGIAALIF